MEKLRIGGIPNEQINQRHANRKEPSGGRKRYESI
jgi:hypothetical protein